MSAPQLTAYQQGQGVVNSDGLNTFEQTCNTVSDLRAFTGLPGIQVAVRGISAAGDGQGGDFYWNATSTAADDNRTVIRPSGVLVGAWLRLGFYVPDAATGTVYVEQYGAEVDNLAFDSYPAFAAALAANPYVKFKAGAYYLSRKLIIPDGKTLEGDAFLPNLANLAGSQLVFANTVSPCVQVGNGGTNNAAGFINGIINRLGTPPAGSIGLLVQDGQSPVIRNVGSVNHAICAKWKADAPFGITSHVRGFYTAGATDAHLVVDSWPELFFTQVRLGCNGAVDVNCNTYLRITGGGTGGSGPNGISFNQWQFNQGQNAPLHAIEIVNVTNTGSNALEFKFSQGHVEGVSAAVIYTDATCAVLNRITITDPTINTPTTPMFALNAATQPSNWSITGGQYFVSDFTLPAAQYIQVAIQGIACLGSGNFTANMGSTFSLASNSWGGAGLTIAGAGRYSITDRLVAGVFTNHATGVVLVQSPDFNGSFAWTPAIAIGGASTGITYAAQQGLAEWLTSDTLMLNFNVTLSNKGALAGDVTVTGLPASLNGTYGSGAGGIVANYTLAGLTGPPVVIGIDSSPTLALEQGSSSGLTSVTNTNLTNTSGFQGSIIVKV